MKTTNSTMKNRKRDIITKKSPRLSGVVRMNAQSDIIPQESAQYELNFFSFIFISLLIIGLTVFQNNHHWILFLIVVLCLELVNCDDLVFIDGWFEC